MKKSLSLILTLLALLWALPSQAAQYELVTQASQLEAGKNYIIASGPTSSKWWGLGTTQNTNNRVAVEITDWVNDNVITPVVNDASVAIVQLEASGDASYPWLLKVTNGATQGYLYASSTSKNNMATQETASTKAQTTITVTSEGVATVKFNNTTKNLLKKNSSSALFSIYGSGQNDVKLFVEESDGGGSVTPTVPGAITAIPEPGEVEEGTEVTFTSQGATSMTATDATGTDVALTAGTGCWTYTVDADINLSVTATNDAGSTGPTAFAYTTRAATPKVYYDLVTSADQLVPGKHYIIGESTEGKAASTVAVSKFLSDTGATIANNRIEVTDNMMIFSLEASGSNGYKLATTNMVGTQGYLTSTTAKTLTVGTEGTELTITIDSDNNATILFGNSDSNVGRILYNKTSPRFLNYATTTNTSTSMLLPELYVEQGGSAVVPAPGEIVADPAAGEVTEGTMVTFTSRGATSMTATDATGTEVTLTQGAGCWTYTVNADITLNVTATNAGGQTGPTTFAYTVRMAQVETPVIAPNGGAIAADQTISISCATADATILYKWDNGAEQTYSAPLAAQAGTLTARATKQGMTDSQEASAVFTIRQPSQGSGTYHLVTAATLADDVANGNKFLLVNTNGSKAASNADLGTNKFLGVADVTITDGKITPGESVMIWEFESSANNAYKLKTTNYAGSAQGYYKTTKAKEMSIAAPGTDAAISLDDEGNAVITFGDYGSIQYNSGVPRFLNYTSNMAKIQLFVEDQAVTQAPEAPVITFGQTTVADNGEYTGVRHGTVFNITSQRATSIVITDEDNNSTTLSTAPFTWTPALGEHLYTVKGVNSIGDSPTVTFDLTVVAAVPDKPVVTYTDGDGNTVTVADNATVSVPQGTVFAIASEGATSVTITDGTNDINLTEAPFTWTPAICSATDYLIGGINAEGTSPLFTLTLTVTRVPQTVAAPTFSPVSGTYFAEAGNVTISAAEGCTLMYALNNGTEVTTTTNTATVALAESDFVNGVARIEAFAANAYGDLSATVTAVYHWGTPQAVQAVFYAGGYDHIWTNSGTQYTDNGVRFDKTEPQYTEVINNDPANPYGYDGGGTPESTKTLVGQSFTNPASGITLSFGRAEKSSYSYTAVFRKDGPGVRFYKDNSITISAPEGKYIESIEYNKTGNFDGFPGETAAPFHAWLNNAGEDSDVANAPVRRIGSTSTSRFMADNTQTVTLTRDPSLASSNSHNDFNTLTVNIGGAGQISNAPLTIPQAIEDQGSDDYVWVVGRIVGSVPDVANRKSALLGHGQTGNTTANILLGQENTADNTIVDLNPANMLAVQCTSAIEPINVVTNLYKGQEVMGKEVRIHGRLATYADGPGMVDADRFIIYLTGNTTGIDDIVVNGQDANAPVEYYNLQGQRVVNPAPGTVVIRRQGSRAAKCIM